MNRAFALMMASAVLWGAGWPALKLLTKTAPPLEVMFVELSGASLFAVCVAFVWRVKMPHWHRVGIAGAIGIIEPGIAYLLFALGIVSTTASSATIIDALQPLIIIFIAAVAFRERSAIGVVPLVILALCGTALSLGLLNVGSFKSGPLIVGDVLVGLGMITAALHSVIMKRVVVELDPVLVTAIQHIVGALIIGAAAILFSHVRSESFLVPDAHDLTIMAGVGVVTLALPFLLYISAVRKISGGLTGIAIAFIPISGLTLSAILVKETLNAIQIVGAIIAIASLFVAARLESQYQYVPRSLV